MSCVVFEGGGGVGLEPPPLFILLGLLQLHLSPISLRPFCLLYKTEEEPFCASKQVPFRRRLVLFSFFFFFYKIIISLHTEQENL